MSEYSDMYRDRARGAWLARWAPKNDPALLDAPAAFRGQYRVTLARAREAEAEVKRYRQARTALKALLEK